MQAAYHIVHIDDRQEDLNRFSLACHTHSPDIALESFKDVAAALACIAAHPPDIIVLDIEMGKLNGLHIAKDLADGDSMIVFLTSHSSYALRAFSLFALHFIVKPVKPADVGEILSRYNRLKPWIKADKLQGSQVNQLSQNLENPGESLKRIFINHLGRTSIVFIEDVLYLEADNTYTRFLTRDGKKLVSSESLKTYDDMLSGHSDLLRVHRSYMVNKKHVKEIRHDRHLWFAVLADGSQVEISRLKKDWVKAELGK